MSPRRRGSSSPSPNEETPLLVDSDTTLDSSRNAVSLKKELGLLEGVAIILGIIIGSGIFITPKGVIKEAGSVGLSLVVWSLSGFLSMIGALCYAELGTSIPKSGADYAYIGEAFGSLPSFLYLWDAIFVFVPTTNAIMSLTVATYITQPFFVDCDPPDVAIRMIAALCIVSLTWLNCYSIKITTKLQNFFMFCKLLAVFLIIIIGAFGFYYGGASHFENIWEGSATNPSQIAVSFYSGIFSYAGWSYLNFMTEELKDPYKNLPRAIFISLPLVTIIYVLANVAYLSVLSVPAMIASDAIAVTFCYAMLGYFGRYMMPVLIAIAALGGLSCHIMTSSRLLFVGARNGHFPNFLSLVTINNFTPVPSLCFLCILSLLYLFFHDIYRLIDYCSFVESMFVLWSVAGLLWLRWTRPDMDRPIKVNLVFPITFLLICTFLVFMPLYVRPLEVGLGLLITVGGIPIYLLGVRWKRPLWIQNSLEKTTKFSQKIFVGVKED